ncbi:MAG: exonuclease domain-containing protein [Candidatus Nanopelagicales bacterium]|nr:exonuclease domain-containing protein [Candidatus Nanopelagicales bacterium]MDZ4249631.1 exonuclease domain-containing protein [Candidatus Nanopelagicales bacterium]
MTWHTGPLAVLDLEATGVDPATARIVEVALHVGGVEGSVDTIVDTLVNPGVPMPADAAAVTGIVTADLETRGADPATILERTVGALHEFAREGVPIVIYNATYDWPLLAAELARHALPTLPDVPPAVIVDPLVLDRHVDKYRKGKRTLSVAAEHYGVRVGGAHRAGADAVLALGVARALAAAYPAVLDVGGTDLVALQVAAHRAWRDDFNAYLQRIGAEREPVSGEWPGV